MANISGIIIIMKMKLIDWHTHILPYMDDGSKSVEESLEMLRQSAGMGVSSVVLTSHFYPHKEEPARFIRRRNRSIKKLTDYLEGLEEESVAPGEDKVNLPKLIPGAEVYYFNELAHIGKEDLKSLCIGESSYIMVELPMEPVDDEIFLTLEALILNRGLTPVLAHIDRYFRFIKDVDSIKRLIDIGMLVQLNVEGLENFFSRRKALKWIDAGMVHMLGSDCHNLTDRAPNLEKGINLLKRTKRGSDFLFGWQESIALHKEGDV